MLSLFAIYKSALICSCSSFHPQILSASLRVAIGSPSSVSDPYSSTPGSPPATLDNTSTCGRPNSIGVHDGSCKVGCAREGDLSGDGVTDGIRDGARDDTQDSAQGSATDGE